MNRPIAAPLEEQPEANASLQRCLALMTEPLKIGAVPGGA
jgi:hypothetical protein